LACPLSGCAKLFAGRSDPTSVTVFAGQTASSPRADAPEDGDPDAYQYASAVVAAARTDADFLPQGKNILWPQP